MDVIRAMRVKEIKAELAQRGVSTTGVFEKEELVQRLYDAWQSSPVPPTLDETYCEGDLFFTSMESGRSIPTYNWETIRIDGVGRPYPSIRIRVEDRFNLTLLLDTACSGFVLRPSTIAKHNIKSYGAPATMTGAGGTVSFSGLVEVGSFTFASETFKALPAAVQDIGALPLALDGIIGLSLLQQFACVELDIDQSKVRVYKAQSRPATPPCMSAIAYGPMVRTRLGIFTVDVWLDDRGPVKMLVDTGASSSFLSWEGVKKLGLSRSEVQPLSNPVGALGSDNIAMQLTHTLPVVQSVTFGRVQSGVVPVNYFIDIGDIAILETQLKADNVVGILGMDLFSQCSRMRVSFGVSPWISLFN